MTQHNRFNCNKRKIKSETKKDLASHARSQHIKMNCKICHKSVRGEDTKLKRLVIPIEQRVTYMKTNEKGTKAK